MLHATVLVSALLASPAGFQSAGNVQVVPVECSPAISNPNCSITIHTKDPSSPLPVKMKRANVVTITVRKRPLESVVIKSKSKDIEGPDAGGAIVKALLPALSALVQGQALTEDFASMFASTEAVASVSGTKPNPETAPNPFEMRVTAIVRAQTLARSALDSAVKTFETADSALADFHGRFTWTEEEYGTAKGSLLVTLDAATKTTLPAGHIQALRVALTEAQKAYNPARASEKSATLLNAAAAQQTTLEADLAEFVSSQSTMATVAQTLANPDYTFALATTKTHQLGVHSTARGRATEATVTLTDLVTGKERELATATASWDTSRWETSAGALFSDLRIRTFEAASHFEGGKPVVVAGTTDVDQFIVQTETRPMVVPFALVHFNLFEVPTPTSRVAVLLTGGMGVNTHTDSADFAWGVSLSHRSVYLSVVQHRARDLRLTGGLTAGQSLGASPPAITTERFWTKSKALVLTVRVF